MEFDYNKIEEHFLRCLKEGKYVEAGNLLMSVNYLSNVCKQEYENTIGFKQKFKHLIPLDSDLREPVYIMAIGCYLESLPKMSLSKFIEEFISSDDSSGFSSGLSSLAEVLKLYCTKKGIIG